MDSSDKIVDAGVSLGAVIAVVISWSTNKSIFYCILHAVLGWFYVIYYWLFRG